ncbi:hypothetical protein pb186bvf_012073 [Paramecium bursaria]
MKQTRMDLILNEINTVRSSLSHKKKYQIMRDSLNAFQKVMEQKNDTRIPRSEIQKLLTPAQDKLRSAKFHITMICFILKLINLKEIADINTSEDVLVYFLKIKDIQKDPLQLKLIQSFMTLIHPEFINFSNYAFVEKCLTMVLYMKCSKNPIIYSSAESSLSRVIELLSQSTQLIIGNKGTSFDNMEIQIELEDPSNDIQKQEKISPTTDNVQVQNLVNILQDLISIADYQRPQWYPQNVPLDREFGLSSINSFLSNMGKFFLDYKSVETVLSQGLIGILKKLLIIPQNMIRQSIIVECYKCLITLIDIGPLLFVELWNLLYNQIKQNEHSIYKNLAFQSLIYLVQSQLFLDTMIRLQFTEKNFILDIITLLSGQSKELQEPSEQDLKRWSEFINPTINLQQQNNLEVLPSDNAFVCRMMAEFQQRFSNSICVFAEMNKIQLGDLLKISNEHDILIKIIDYTWKLNLRSIKYILSKESDEITIQSALIAIQNYILLVGSLQLRNPQSATIKTICEYCKPQQGQDFTKRHIQINKMVLNIANCLGNLLECSSWILIFKTFEECENFYLRNRVAKNQSQEEQTKQVDISILFQSLDQLFTQSQTYGNEHLLTVMDAINQITIESLEANDSEQKRKFQDSKIKLFSLQKLIDLIKNNLQRLDIFWEVIMAHFISVVSSRNTMVAQSATETLSTIIFLGFEFLCQHFKKQGQQGFIKEKWSQDLCLYQYTLFQPWIDLCAIRQNEIKEIILANLLKMLQNNGFDIQAKGWDAVVLILLQISNEGTSLFVKQGLSCTEYMINQFLQAMSQQQISKLFDIIDNFKQNSNEQNINFQICNMLWHLGDFITKNSVSSNSQVDYFLPKIFYKLSLISQDSVTEIRHSAIHIFTNLLLHFNADQQNLYIEWKRILEQIFFEMLQKVVQTFVDKQAAKENDVGNWEETAKSVFQSFIKLIKKYFVIVDETSNSKDDDITRILQLIVPEMILALQQNRAQLSLEVAKIIKELFQYKSTLCLQNYGPLLDQLSQMFNGFPQDMKYLKTLILLISNEIIELLVDMIKMHSDLHIDKIFEIYLRVLEFPVLAHMSCDLIQNRIYFEDNLAPKNIMSAIQITIQKCSNKFISHLQSTVIKLMQDPPSNKFKYILISRVIKQITLVIQNNIPLFGEFQQFIVKILDILLHEQQYVHFQDTLNEEKSLWLLLLESIFQPSKQFMEQHTNFGFDQQVLFIKNIQSILPKKQYYLSASGVQEKVKGQELLLPFITEFYTTHPDLCDQDVFKQYIHELQQLSSFYGDQALEPLNQLLQLSKDSLQRCQLCLQFIIDSSTQIIKGFIKQNQQDIKKSFNFCKILKYPKEHLMALRQMIKNFNKILCFNLSTGTYII